MEENALSVALTAARDASEAILDIYSLAELDVQYKEDNSPLTRADTESNALIVSRIRKAFPDHAILAEESRDDKSRLDNDWCWIVDPLDGTKEFVKRNGEFTVNIALAHRHQPVLGVVLVPVLGELYYAERGKGAWYQKGDGDPVQIHVSDHTEGLRLAVSRSHASEGEQRLMENPRVADVIKAGSSIKGCLVARGEADIYYRFGPTMEWDTAAMQCIVEEAGGIFRQMDGTEMRYNREDNLNANGFYVLNRAENLFV
jgi:3'(2'), 5'-bisphosphate nucleotidase